MVQGGTRVAARFQQQARPEGRGPYLLLALAPGVAPSPRLPASGLSSHQLYGLHASTRKASHLNEFSLGDGRLQPGWGAGRARRRKELRMHSLHSGPPSSPRLEDSPAPSPLMLGKV